VDPVSLRRLTLEEVQQGGLHLVDFDGTMTTGGYPDIGEYRPKVIAYLSLLRTTAPVVIWTCRTSLALCKTPIDVSEAVRQIEAWLTENEIDQIDGILMHDKPICISYIGDETIHPDEIERVNEIINLVALSKTK
jgi:hypothetical protein